MKGGEASVGMPVGPQRRGASAPLDSAEFEETLLRAMEEDPRLASGAGVSRADNVLDFIQMTGLTTGRVPAPAAAPGEASDDPISFFEYGVRDVDGSGDPVELTVPELDTDAFHIDTRELIPAESQSLNELRQIIADLAEMDNPGRADPPVSSAAAIEEAAPEAGHDEDEYDPITVDLGPEVPTDSGRPAEVDSFEPLIVEQSASPMHSATGLAAARDLMRELSLANRAAEETERALARRMESRAPAGAPAPDDLDVNEGPGSLPPQHEDDAPTTHHGLVRRRSAPMIGRWLVRLLAAVLCVGAGYGGYLVYERQTQPPRAAYEAAEKLIAEGRFRDASDAFLDFSQRYAGNPRRADALFMAGYALQLTPEDPAPRAKEAYTEALELLRHFIDEYPAHEKTARAETLIGVLYYKTDRYLEAINVLGDPDRRLRDPGVYLTTLRTLARAYAGVGQMENARSAYMRAASLENNMAPDQDYGELAETYQRLAERTGDPALRRQYFQQAVEQWEFALQVPGLLKNHKEDMKLLRDVAASKLDKSPGSNASAATPAGVRVRTITRGTADRGSDVSAPGDAAASESPE